MLLSRRLVVHGVASTWKSKGMFLNTAESKDMNWITCYATDDIEDLFKQVASDPFCHPNVERVNMGGLVDEFWSVIFQGFFMLGPFFFFYLIRRQKLLNGCRHATITIWTKSSALILLLFWMLFWLFQASSSCFHR